MRAAPAEKLLLVLRDGRKIIGTMRSFDQFSNIVLEHAEERVVVGKRFADVPLGLYVIRGDAVVLLGEVAPELEASDAHPRERPIADVVALEESGEGTTAVVWDIEDL